MRTDLLPPCVTFSAAQGVYPPLSLVSARTQTPSFFRPSPSHAIRRVMKFEPTHSLPILALLSLPSIRSCFLCSLLSTHSLSLCLSSSSHCAGTGGARTRHRAPYIRAVHQLHHIQRLRVRQLRLCARAPPNPNPRLLLPPHPAGTRFCRGRRGRGGRTQLGYACTTHADGAAVWVRVPPPTRDRKGALVCIRKESWFAKKGSVRIKREGERIRTYLWPARWCCAHP